MSPRPVIRRRKFPRGEQELNGGGPKDSRRIHHREPIWAVHLELAIDPGSGRKATGTMSMTPEKSRKYAEAAVAAVLLLLVLPLIAVGAALSLLQYRAWPFFVHDRVGEGGRTFRLYKIRTLPPGTNRYADKYAVHAAGIPPLMQVVRRLHFDELPQLAHVVTGKMSFVGPRPEMPTLHEALPPAFATLRTSVRPGLTCLWQISPHSHGLIGERTEYDRLYADHRSALLDLWIIARTVRKMTTGRTSHLFEVPQWAVGVGPAPAAAPAPRPTWTPPVAPAAELGASVPEGALSFVD